ncbi:MAG: hypothetical protein QM534_09810 [Sediminibacterium sp.]|nr:hypothetical protein [Sediminibacterium sp.]
MENNSFRLNEVVLTRHLSLIWRPPRVSNSTGKRYAKCSSYTYIWYYTQAPVAGLSLLAFCRKVPGGKRAQTGRSIPGRIKRKQTVALNETACCNNKYMK